MLCDKVKTRKQGSRQGSDREKQRRCEGNRGISKGYYIETEGRKNDSACNLVECLYFVRASYIQTRG